MYIKELAPGKWYVVTNDEEVAGPYATAWLAKRAYPNALVG